MPRKASQTERPRYAMQRRNVGNTRRERDWVLPSWRLNSSQSCSTTKTSLESASSGPDFVLNTSDVCLLGHTVQLGLLSNAVYSCFVGDSVNICRL